MARNQLSGTVSRIQPGAVYTEVVLDLSGALTLAASINNESAVSVDLKVGASVTGMFKASSVILGVAA